MHTPHRIEHGRKFRIASLSPTPPKNAPSKPDGIRATETLLPRLYALQEKLFADGRKGLLIVLQAMDTGGKDGTVQHVFSGVNPMGCRVTSFKAPTPEELRHPFLWRATNALPPRGSIGIFNRSHYEDVLVVRVHDLVPKPVWSRRYSQINEWERMLTEDGYVVLKFFLHIGRDEQKERLQARLDDPAKRWKFEPADLAERKHWDDYMKAYQDVIRKCSTPWAPWVVVPSNRKWYRNLVVASAIVDALQKLDLKLPEPDFDPSAIRIE